MEEKEKYPTAALRRKARRLRWKQEKAARRQALKDHYRDAESFTINGVKETAGGIMNPQVNPDPINYLVNTRMTVELEPGDIVTPVYEVNQINEETGSRDNNDENGDVIKIKKSSGIKSEKLPNGYYLNSAVISDFRGDVYYSQVVGNKVTGGKVSERNVDAAFQGRDY